MQWQAVTAACRYSTGRRASDVESLSNGPRVVVRSLTDRPTARVRWLGLRAGGRLALLYIHQMNRVISRNDLVVSHDDSTINIVLVIIFLPSVTMIAREV